MVLDVPPRPLYILSSDESVLLSSTRAGFPLPFSLPVTLQPSLQTTGANSAITDMLQKRRDGRTFPHRALEQRGARPYQHCAAVKSSPTSDRILLTCSRRGPEEKRRLGITSSWQALGKLLATSQDSGSRLRGTEARLHTGGKNHDRTRNTLLHYIIEPFLCMEDYSTLMAWKPSSIFGVLFIHSNHVNVKLSHGTF
jgi:hypothetical protein